MNAQELKFFSDDLEKLVAETVIKVINNTAASVKENSSKRYFKKKAFCEEMEISFNTLANWIKMGLPVIQVEGIQLIDMQDAVKFLSEHKI